MAKSTPPADEERLPWLEPYRDAIAQKAPPKAKPNKRGAGLVAGGVAAIAAALTAGYYIGQREPTPQSPPVAMAEAPVTPASPAPASPAPVNPAPMPPPAPAASPPIAQAAPPARAEPAPARKKYAAKRAKKPVRRTVRQRKIRNAGIESARLREVRAAQERAPAPRPVARTNYRPWPRMPSPGPAGQVIQLGAFRNPARANAAYRTRLARYPMLGSMPRVVVPVVTKPRGRVLYVLRLGTSSRQQSRIVCRNLRASGDHCIVIG